MKWFIFFLSCFSIFSLGAFAESQPYLTKDQIIMTEAGIFILDDGVPVPVSHVSYLGSGIFAAEYYGQCGRCGWALDKNGKCTNQNCNQYGPRDRD